METEVILKISKSLHTHKKRLTNYIFKTLETHATFVSNNFSLKSYFRCANPCTCIP